jgi:signal peptidase II
MRAIDYREHNRPSTSRCAPPEAPPDPAWDEPAAAGTDRPARGRKPARGREPGGPAAWIRVGLVMVAVLAADQLSKHAVEESITAGETRKLLPGIELVNTRNRGVAFGFLPGSHLAVTILIAVALVALLAYFALHSGQRLIWLPTGLLLGGALGNVLDRLREGSVTDFIKLPLGWPPFNLADASITLGVLLLLLSFEAARKDSLSASKQEHPRVDDPTGASR